MCEYCASLNVCKFAHLKDDKEFNDKIKEIIKELPSNFQICCKYYNSGFVGSNAGYPSYRGVGCV